jgi:hypothetical protein
MMNVRNSYYPRSLQRQLPQEVRAPHAQPVRHRPEGARRDALQAEEGEEHERHGLGDLNVVKRRSSRRNNG